MLTFNNVYPTKARHAFMTMQNYSQTNHDDLSVSILSIQAQRAAEVSGVVGLLEETGYLRDKTFCLQLAGHLAQHAGHLCAGSSSRATVYELMKMSMRASELVEKIDNSYPS